MDPQNYKSSQKFAVPKLFERQDFLTSAMNSLLLKTIQFTKQQKKPANSVRQPNTKFSDYTTNLSVRYRSDQAFKFREQATLQFQQNLEFQNTSLNSKHKKEPNFKQQKA